MSQGCNLLLTPGMQMLQPRPWRTHPCSLAAAALPAQGCAAEQHVGSHLQVRNETQRAQHSTAQTVHRAVRHRWEGNRGKFHVHAPQRPKCKINNRARSHQEHIQFSLSQAFAIFTKAMRGGGEKTFLNTNKPKQSLSSSKTQGWCFLPNTFSNSDAEGSSRVKH